MLTGANSTQNGVVEQVSDAGLSLGLLPDWVQVLIVVAGSVALVVSLLLVKFGKRSADEKAASRDHE